MTPLAEALDREQATRDDLVAVLVDSCSASESLLHDLFAIIANADPDTVAALRDRAAVVYQGAVDDPGQARDRGHFANRFSMLNAVMTGVGRPFESAEVVSLSEHWKRRG